VFDFVWFELVGEKEKLLASEPPMSVTMEVDLVRWLGSKGRV
jgi:hypothetical protein